MSHTRRDFLKTSLGASTLVSLGSAVPTLLGRPAVAAGPKGRADDTILVVVQLAGGNDGLNTIVPYEDDQYARNRPTLRLPAGELHKIDSLLGFHPQMQAFSRLYKEGHLSILHGVGYPNRNGDHAAAMHDWQTAKPHQTNCQTGWLGRAIDEVCGGGQTDVPAVFLGQIPRPLALNAEKTVVPAIRSLDELTLRTMGPAAGGVDHRRRLAELARLSRPAEKDPTLDFLRRSSLEAYAGSQRLQQTQSRTSVGAAKYPPFQLAETFKIVSRLIRAELGIRVFYTELGGTGPGGFDNHANQRHNHGALLRQLSESVAAFVYDLQRDKLLDRVLLMTFSEFGRTVKENGRRGTGHGSAAPLFLAGGKVKGGLVGAHPNLAELENGGQKFHTDFRRVYATVLESWLGLDSQSALGGRFQPLDVLRV